MVFGDLNTKDGLKSLNEYLATRSYIEGYQASQADVAIIESVKQKPSQDLHHALRWYNHINSYGDGKKKLPGVKKDLSAYGASAANATSTPKESKKADDDDDVDLFGSDEEDPEAERLKQERLQMYQEKKAKKPGVIAKSSVVLYVKPWDDETDMKAMEQKVRTIECDGLLWGASKLVPVGYGINKLQIGCVVEDEKVSIDWLSEEIEKFEDVVQSVDIAAFNKI